MPVKRTLVIAGNQRPTQETWIAEWIVGRIWVTFKWVVSRFVEKTIDALNKQLANWSVLFIKLHHLHWYVTGRQFFTLHEKFEELYNKSAEYMDDLAERVLTLKGKPLSTMKEYLEMASIQEASGRETSDQMVQTLLQDLEIVIRETKEGMKQAEQEGDESTADMFLGIISEMEKETWLFHAFIEGETTQSSTSPRHVYYTGKGSNAEAGK